MSATIDNPTCYHCWPFHFPLLHQQYPRPRHWRAAADLYLEHVLFYFLEGLVQLSKEGKSYLQVNRPYFYRVNYKAKTTCTKSSGVKTNLGLDQDQQCTITPIERLKRINLMPMTSSCPGFWSGTSLRTRLMRGVFLNANYINLFSIITPPFQVL